MIAPIVLPAAEPLEARIAPATVSASISGSLLRITALSLATPVEATLKQVNSTTFHLFDDGASDPVVFENMKSIQIHLSDADDHFLFETVSTLRGSFTVKGGAGTDAVEFGGAGNIFGKVSVTLDKGEVFVSQDVAILSNLNVATVGGGVTIHGKIENLTANVVLATLDATSEIGGKVRITTPAADSEIIAKGIIRGSLTVVGNIGNDVVRLGGNTGGKVTLALKDGVNKLDTSEGFSISRGLTYRGGSERDDINLNAFGNATAPVINGAIKLFLGDGLNSVVFTDSGGGFSGPIQVNGGSGIDNVGIFGATIFGVFRANLGDRSGDLTITNAILAGGLQFRGGNNQDYITITDTTLGGNSKVNLGAGADDATFRRLDVSGAFTVIGSSGRNEVAFDRGEFHGKVSLSLGNGNINSVDAKNGIFHGGISYKGGAGSDFLSILDSVVTGPLNFSGGNGPNRFLASDLTALTLFNYQGGQDSDQVTIQANSGEFFRGNIKLGAGDDEATISTGMFISLRVDGGAGADTLSRIAAAVAAGLIEKGFETTNSI